jgi:hypothetical protein
MGRVRDEVESAVAGWQGTSARPHRFGGVEFRYGTREIGHLHGDALLDIPFPRRIHDELIAAGKALPHHVLPDSGWVSFRPAGAEDAGAAITLLRRSYDLIVEQSERRKTQSATARAVAS